MVRFLFCLLIFILQFQASYAHRLHSVDGLSQVHEYHMLERFDEALALVDHYLGQDLTPYQKGWALLLKGNILTRTQHAKEALELYDEVLMHYVSYDTSGILLPSALYEKSKAMSKAGNQLEAIETLNKAIDLTSQIEYPDFNKEFRMQQMSIREGRYLFQSGRPLEAIESFKASINNLESHLAKTDSEYIKHRIRCELSVAFKEQIDVYDYLGKEQEALDSCKVALEYAMQENPNSPDHPWIKMLNQRISRLEGSL